ncbi:MAG: dUTP diphosphatase [Alicyclobacillus sp.]|nr:dUTP diphosphatase [Alicyclobacillus sp.]
MDALRLAVKYRVVSDCFQPTYLPQYQTEGSAGLDLHACIPSPVELAPLQRERVPTGIAIEIPSPQVVALVYARSGLAWRHGIGLPNGVGVIDSDYTGEIQVLLTNFGNQPYVIQPGDRIAQLVFAPVHHVVWVEAETLRETARGTAGFGSTGTRGRS